MKPSIDKPQSAEIIALMRALPVLVLDPQQHGSTQVLVAKFDADSLR